MISIKRILTALMVVMGAFLAAAAFYHCNRPEMHVIAALVAVDALLFFIGAYWFWMQKKGYYIGGMVFLLANVAATIPDQLGLIDFLIILLLLAMASLLFLYNQKHTEEK